MAAFYQNPLKNEVPLRYRTLIDEFGITPAIDPYAELKRLDFEKWRYDLEAALNEWRKKHGYVGSKAGRPGFDPVFMFTVYIVQTRFGLTDLEMVGEMTSDIRFKSLLGTWHPDDVPSVQTLWTYREMWAESRTLERLFDRHLEEMRQILPDLGEKAVAVDSTMMPVPIPRNTPAENDLIKAGKADELWVDEPNKKRHKDCDSGWTQKGGRRFHGYKLHVVACLIWKIITDFLVSPANMHDSTAFATMALNLTDYSANINPDGTLPANSSCVTGDSAYIGEKLQDLCEGRGWNIRACERGTRSKKLSEASKAYNRVVSKVRSRIEHLFGFARMSMRAHKLRCVGMKRAKSALAGLCLVYNICRLMQLGVY